MTLDVPLRNLNLTARSGICRQRQLTIMESSCVTAADIRQRGIRRRAFERFISELEKLPEAVSEFDETLWGSLVDYVTVGKDKTMVFTLIGGTEMRA